MVVECYSYNSEKGGGGQTSDIGNVNRKKYKRERKRKVCENQTKELDEQLRPSESYMPTTPCYEW